MGSKQGEKMGKGIISMCLQGSQWSSGGNSVEATGELAENRY